MKPGISIDKFVIGIFISLLTLSLPSMIASVQAQDVIYLPIILKPLTVDGTIPQAISITPTSRAASVVSPFVNDLNNNNLATLYYREFGSDTWLEGPIMSKISGMQAWRGSIVSLNAETAYEVEVRYQDSDGVAPTKVNGLFTTLSDYPDVGGGGTTYTVPTDGSLNTVLDLAEPGDTIQLLSGIYRDPVTIDATHSGTADQYLTIEPAPGATVIFDGSDPNINSAGDDWTFYTSSPKGDVYYKDLSYGDTNYCGSSMMPGYVGQMYNNERVRYLLFDSEDDWDNDFLTAPAGKAYYVCNSSGPGPTRRLYVVTLAGDDPDNQEMHVAEQSRGIHLRGADYVRIRGLQFRHYSWNAVQLGYDTQSGADHNIIENNTFHGIGQYHIRVSGKEGNDWVAHNLIQNNQFSEAGYRDLNWTWDEAYHKARSGVVGIWVNFTGPGNQIVSNTLTSGHDGIEITHESDDIDIYNNVITECMDDGISIDNNPGQNIRVWGNTVNYCYLGISLQDWNNEQPGPVYIFRNVLIGGLDPQNRLDYLGGSDGYNASALFKVGSDQSPAGSVYIYHNTLTNIQNNNGHGIRDSGGNYFANLTTRNNIWNVDGRVIYLNSGNSLQNHNFDCDNMHNIDPGDNKFVTWGNGNVYTNLATFQSQTGQQPNGISDNGTSFEANLHLKAGSPDIDAGCIVPGFSDGYVGSAPDLGAFEYSP